MRKVRFNGQVRRKLKALGKTQKELADTMHYSPTYICDVLNGRGRRALREEIMTVIRGWEQEAAARKRAP